MIQILRPAHIHWRYIIFLFAVMAVIAMFVGWLGKRKWGSWGRLNALLYPTVLDIQFVFGILLWIAEKRWQGPDFLRSWEHPMTMVLALGFAHMGAVMTKKDRDDVDKYKLGAIFFTISVALVVAGVIRVHGGL